MKFDTLSQAMLVVALAAGIISGVNRGAADIQLALAVLGAASLVSLGILRTARGTAGRRMYTVLGWCATVLLPVSLLGSEIETHREGTIAAYAVLAGAALVTWALEVTRSETTAESETLAQEKCS